MATKAGISTKRLQIDKANAVIVAATSIAAFLTVFSLVSCRALLSQRAYQARVITEKSKANKQLDSNIKAVQDLKKSYTVFIADDVNLIGGSKAGDGDRDGDNAKIILDALPSVYDYPAVASSLEKVISENKSYKLLSITGKDDEINQNKANATAKPVEIPFSISVGTNYQGSKDLLAMFEKSIRPISIQTLTISGTGDNLTMNVAANTYYQPERNHDNRTL